VVHKVQPVQPVQPVQRVQPAQPVQSNTRLQAVVSPAPLPISRRPGFLFFGPRDVQRTAPKSSVDRGTGVTAATGGSPSSNSDSCLGCAR
jgi:hypothetical protein